MYERLTRDGLSAGNLLRNAPLRFACKLSALALMSTLVLGPVAASAQESHEDAKAQVEARDRHHHNKAKIVGGSAAGGAAVGALAGGPVGAVVGAGVGAGGGVVANKVRKHHSIKKREKTATPDGQ